MKKVVSAYIDKILEFDSLDEAKKYLDGMRTAGKNFHIMWECDLTGGKREIRIREQYYGSPMDSCITSRKRGAMNL